MDNNAPYTAPLYREHLINSLNELSAAACSITVIEKLLDEHIDTACDNDTEPNYFFMGGLFHCVKCLADQVASNVDKIKKQAEIC